MIKGDYIPEGIEERTILFPLIEREWVGRRLVGDKNHWYSEIIQFKDVVPNQNPQYKRKIDVYDSLTECLQRKKDHLESLKDQGTPCSVEFRKTEFAIDAYNKALRLLRNNYFNE